MSVLREEDGHLAGTTGDVGLCQRVAVLRDVLLGIILERGKVLQRRVAEGLLGVEGYLDVNHVDVGLQHGGLAGTALRCGDVDKEILVLDGVLAFLHRVQVVVFQKRHDVGKQRIQSRVLAEVVKCVDNHSYIFYSLCRYDECHCLFS